MATLFHINSKDSANTEETVSSSYHRLSNGQIESIIKFLKGYYQKCTDTKSNIHTVLLQIPSTPVRPGLPSPAMLLFNHPIRGIMPITDRLLISSN